MIKTIIYTDGSSKGNPGPGGWGAILIERPNPNEAGDSCKTEININELGGREDHTTNNRMELSAVINGISSSCKGSEVTVLSDSKYIINGITSWIFGWKKNNWRTSAKKAVLNKDLWIKLDECTVGRTIKWKYVEGHAGVVGNERCDQIATSFADNEKIRLYKGSIDGYDFKNIVSLQ